jgi:hypothetical protein
MGLFLLLLGAQFTSNLPFDVDGNAFSVPLPVVSFFVIIRAD